MLNDASLCRTRGWKPGTKLLVTETDGELEVHEIHQITAIGLRKVLTTLIAYKDPGEPWDQVVNPEAWETATWINLNNATEWTPSSKEK